MFRKAKASKTTITTILTLLFSVCFFTPIEPSRAQIVIQPADCRGSILTNGNFTKGLVAGPLNGSGTVSNWTAAYGSPDVGVNPGCHDPGFIGMWGNRTKGIGEAIQQAVSLVAGKTYIGSLCFKVIPTNQPSAIFRLRASQLPKTFWDTLDTVYESPSIASTVWNDYFFAFTATSNTSYLTINVENLFSINDGSKTSYAHVDNVCIRELNFNWTKACKDQATAFTSTPGATSYDWDFGDNMPHSNQQNPTHTYASAGTYQVKLCVNGTTNCVTKTVAVSAPPPAPVITGPSKACGLPVATYFVPPPPVGVAYSWSVTNGTFTGGVSTGNSVGVIWDSMGVGTITVTATNKAGCTSSTTLRVVLCDVNPGDCCLDFKFKENASSLVSAGGVGLYNFTTNLTVNMPNIIGVTANVISSSLTYSPASCGVSGPVNSYVVSASNVGTLLTALVQPLNGHEVLWQGGASNINNTLFQMQIKFPPAPTGHCKDALTFCVKYTFTDRNCKTCSVIRCYGPFKRGGGPHPEDPTKNPQ